MTPGSKIVVIDHPGRWSDTPYYCTAALIREVERVVVLGTLDDGLRRRFLAQATDYYARFHRRYIPDRDLALMQRRAEGISQTLNSHADADAIVVFHPPDAAFLQTNIPIAIFHDATWRQFTSTYPGFSQGNLTSESYQSGFTAESMAFNKARWLFFMSQWAANGAHLEYPSQREKIHVIYPGANLPQAPGDSIVDQTMERRISGQCHLLFVGYEGYRKGIDIAVGTVHCLRSLGIDAVLHVVGTNLERIATADFICWYGQLSKLVASEFSLLSELYQRSFVLLLPSRAECAGIVICEAAAFGVPAIVPTVGGMPELVIHGKTGYVISSAANAGNYASVIAHLWRDSTAYRELCENARARYQDLLNWDQSVKSLTRLLIAQLPISTQASLPWLQQAAGIASADGRK